MVYNGGAVEHTHRFPHILSFFFSSARRVPPPPAGESVAPQVHEPGAAPTHRSARKGGCPLHFTHGGSGNEK